MKRKSTLRSSQGSKNLTSQLQNAFNDDVETIISLRAVKPQSRKKSSRPKTK